MRQLKIHRSITSRRSDSLEIYFQDISKEKLLTIEEEVMLAKRARLGDPGAMNKLVNANLRFVVSVAKQYQHRGLSLPDLISEGNIGLIKAARHFDETKGFKFISYAVWWIRQSILSAITHYAEMIRIPSNKIKEYYKTMNAENELQQKMERQPTISELAETIHTSEKNVAASLETPKRMVSLQAPLSEDSNSSKLVDVMVDPDSPLPDDRVMKESLRVEVDRIFSSLNNSRETEILRLYYGIGTDHAATVEEIGGSFKLSCERIRQIKDKALERIRSSKKEIRRIMSN